MVRKLSFSLGREFSMCSQVQIGLQQWSRSVKQMTYYFLLYEYENTAT